MDEQKLYIEEYSRYEAEESVADIVKSHPREIICTAWLVHSICIVAHGMLGAPGCHLDRDKRC